MASRSPPLHPWAKQLCEGACHETNRIARISVSRPSSAPKPSDRRALRRGCLDEGTTLDPLDSHAVARLCPSVPWRRPLSASAPSALAPGACPPFRPTCRKANDVLKVLEEADTAIWSASALSACAESGLLARLGQPATVGELASALSLPPALVQSLLDVLAGFGFVTWEDGKVQASPALMPFTSPRGSRDLQGRPARAAAAGEDFRHRLTTAAL